MDGRAQLEELALAITGASSIDAAWAGTGEMQDIRKTCGLCHENQPVRIPFLRHVCRGCTAIWVPGICVDCAHTSVTFTLDGQLSPTATCGCTGRLRQVAYVPKPRAHVPPEVAAARAAVLDKQNRHLTLTARVVLVVIAAAAVVGCVSWLRATHAPAAVPQAAVVKAVTDSASLSPAVRGRLAANRLTRANRGHDVFTCTTQLSPMPTPAPTPGLSAAEKDFLAACLAG